MLKITPEQRQIAKAKNWFIFQVKVDASTRAKGETDATFEFNGPMSPERRKELLDLVSGWLEKKQV